MSWLRDAVIPQDLQGAPPARWARHPAVIVRATLALAFLDLTMTCRHLRAHPDAPDIIPLPAPILSRRVGVPRIARVPQPDRPDPAGGRISLAESLAGLACPDAPVAEISTSMGTLRCDLWPSLAPTSVAWFAGLARGLRPFWDGVEGRWKQSNFYDDTVFHIVRSGRWIQGGDLLRSGEGDPGFTFADENTAPHDRSGLLCMANAAPNQNHGQFVILVSPRPSLDGRYSIFGRCSPTALVDSIAEVPASGERPRAPVVVHSVRVGCGGPTS